MPDTALVASGRLSPILVVLAIVAVMLGGAAVLWATYGTAVFFQMIVTGLAYCF